MERTTLNIPVIALRGLTVFPDLTLSFDVEREISIYALDNAMEGDRSIFLVTQREIATTAPTEQDLYTVGTICRILQIIKTSETSVRVIVEGQQRAASTVCGKAVRSCRPTWSCWRRISPAG